MIAQPQILNNFKFFAGADVARSAGATAGTVVSPGILAVGEMVITDASNVILDVASVLTTTSPIKIVMGRGTDTALWESQLFNYSDIRSYKGVEYAAKVQQVSYYGYNAVTNTGAFDVINDNYYTLVISFYELVSQEASALFNPILVDYLSDASATQPEIVNGLYKQLVRQLSYWSKKPVLAEMVSSAASAALVGTATTLTFTKGSPIVTLNGTVTNVVVGDYLRVSPDVTVNDLDPVYRVIAINSPTSITLETPYQSDNLAAPVAQVEVITAALVAAGNMGIRITGLNQQFILDSRPYGLVTFQIGLSGGGSTNLSYQIGAYIGHGTYEQMRTQEAASWRNQGVIFNYTEFPPISVFTDLIAAQNHSTLDIVLEKPVKALNISEFRAQLTLACALDGNVANTFKSSYIGASGVVTVLDTYISNYTNLTAQATNL
jgi:hypothetical protein